MIIWVAVVVDSVDDVADLLFIDAVHVADVGFVLVAIQIALDVNKQVVISPAT